MIRAGFLGIGVLIPSALTHTGSAASRALLSVEFGRQLIDECIRIAAMRTPQASASNPTIRADQVALGVARNAPDAVRQRRPAM
jgi:hypothetical protein